jgi:hypothetical protein
MGGEHGGSQVLFHSAYCYIPLHAPLAHINLIKTWFKPIFGDAKRRKGRIPFTTLLLSFHHYSDFSLLTTVILLQLSSANVWEFFLLLCPSDSFVLNNCTVTRHLQQTIANSRATQRICQSAHDRYKCCYDLEN